MQGDTDDSSPPRTYACTSSSSPRRRSRGGGGEGGRVAAARVVEKHQNQPQPPTPPSDVDERFPPEEPIFESRPTQPPPKRPRIDQDIGPAPAPAPANATATATSSLDKARNSSSCGGNECSAASCCDANNQQIRCVVTAISGSSRNSENPVEQGTGCCSSTDAASNFFKPIDSATELGKEQKQNTELARDQVGTLDRKQLTGNQQPELQHGASTDPVGQPSNSAVEPPKSTENACSMHTTAEERTVIATSSSTSSTNSLANISSSPSVTTECGTQLPLSSTDSQYSFTPSILSPELLVKTRALCSEPTITRSSSEPITSPQRPFEPSEIVAPLAPSTQPNSAATNHTTNSSISKGATQTSPFSKKLFAQAVVVGSPIRVKEDCRAKSSTTVISFKKPTPQECRSFPNIVPSVNSNMGSPVSVVPPPALQAPYMESASQVSPINDLPPSNYSAQQVKILSQTPNQGTSKKTFSAPVPPPTSTPQKILQGSFGDDISPTYISPVPPPVLLPFGEGSICTEDRLEPRRQNADHKKKRNETSAYSNHKRKGQKDEEYEYRNESESEEECDNSTDWEADSEVSFRKQKRNKRKNKFETRGRKPKNKVGRPPLSQAEKRNRLKKKEPLGRGGKVSTGRKVGRSRTDCSQVDASKKHKGKPGKSSEPQNVKQNSVLFVEPLQDGLLDNIHSPSHTTVSPSSTPSELPQKRGNTTINENDNLAKRRKKQPSAQTLADYVNDEENYQKCSRILNAIYKHRDAPDFRHPVDAVALDIPDYHDIIKMPMDLSTVQNKLASRDSYRNCLEFASDMRLIFANAMLYNPVGHRVHLAAEKLLKVLEGKLKRVFPTSESANVPDLEDSNTATLPTTDGVPSTSTPAVQILPCTDPPGRVAEVTSHTSASPKHSADISASLRPSTKSRHLGRLIQASSGRQTPRSSKENMLLLAKSHEEQINQALQVHKQFHPRRGMLHSQNTTEVESEPDQNLKDQLDDIKVSLEQFLRDAPSTQKLCQIAEILQQHHPHLALLSNHNHKGRRYDGSTSIQSHCTIDLNLFALLDTPTLIEIQTILGDQLHNQPQQQPQQERKQQEQQSHTPTEPNTHTTTTTDSNSNQTETDSTSTSLVIPAATKETQQDNHQATSTPKGDGDGDGEEGDSKKATPGSN
ncbi:Transcription factor GTE4 [Pelomyxa schiedti]|nr:Transcription factor GTE4 [Pelomyxa schiedti]